VLFFFFQAEDVIRHRNVTGVQTCALPISEQSAREAGHEVVTAQVPFGGAAGSALLRDDVTGTAQLVVDRSARTLLGATFVGPDAAEMLHAATIAKIGRASCRERG